MAYPTHLVSRAAWGTLAIALAGTTLVLDTRPDTSATTEEMTRADVQAHVVFPPAPDHEQYATIEAVRTYTPAPVAGARIAIVPHHMVAARGIARGIEALARHEPQPSTVVLLSPDHFNACATTACTTSGTFPTPYGTIATDDVIVRMLQSSPLVTENSSLFEDEHGIRTILPFVRALLPQAEVVPLVVSVEQYPNHPEQEALSALLQELLRSPTVSMVVSSDFSHYLDLAEATQKDATSVQALCEQDGDALRTLSVPDASDCPLCLWHTNELAHTQGLVPTIVWHSNSAILLGTPDIEETTSHVVVLYTTQVQEHTCLQANTLNVP